MAPKHIKKKETSYRNLVIGSKYGFASLLILSGLLLSYFRVGASFMGFASVGSWLTYIGFVMLAIVTIRLISPKKRIVDERMQFVATKAARVTFTAIIIAAFTIMVIDGIRPITLAYSYFMNYLICGIVLVYFISYKILLQFY